MIGRQDVAKRTCGLCKGTGRSPRNRKRKCNQCDGTGQAYYCTNCGEVMPCRGQRSGMIDQAWCGFNTGQM